MKINKFDEVEESEVQMEGAEDVTIKILVGPEDGSDNIIMRYFKVRPNGHTPLHKHHYEHIVKVEKGKGQSHSQGIDTGSYGQCKENIDVQGVDRFFDLLLQFS